MNSSIMVEGLIRYAQGIVALSVEKEIENDEFYKKLATLISMSEQLQVLHPLNK